MNPNDDNDKKKGCLGCLATPFGIMLIILAVILIILFFSIGGGDLLKSKRQMKNASQRD